MVASCNNWKARDVFEHLERIFLYSLQGYIVPEYFRWPGYLSPEKGIKLPDSWLQGEIIMLTSTRMYLTSGQCTSFFFSLFCVTESGLLIVFRVEVMS